jgi:hypothetical protein
MASYEALYHNIRVNGLTARVDIAVLGPTTVVQLSWYIDLIFELPFFNMAQARYFLTVYELYGSRNLSLIWEYSRNEHSIIV